MHRETMRLEIVDQYYPAYDRVLNDGTKADYEKDNAADCDLVCGKDGEIILRNSTIEQAQHFFQRKGIRTLGECCSCGSYNLLAAAIEIGPDGRVVKLPKREE